MAKKKIKRNNKYFIGGILEDFGNWNDKVSDKLMGSSLGKGLGKLGVTKEGLGGIANTAATAIGGVLAGGNESGVGNALQGIGSLASNIPGVGGLIGAGVNLLGGITNAAFGSNLNEEEIAKVEGQIDNLNSFTSNASDYDALASNYTNMPNMGYFSKDDIGSDGWFSDKAKDKWEELKKEKEQAEQWVQNSLFNNAQNIATNKQQLLEANYTAYGGPINMKYTGVMSPFGNQFKDGGIYIKPSKRGTFTAAAKKRGMDVQEFANKVLANKEDYSPAMVKKANFARNTSKWKHADGGQLFTNGVTTIGNGGTHEENPFEGVPMGVDQQGIPNLVEEGEVIFDDYVFSNRLRVPKAVRQKYKLRGTTFADAAKQLQKESEERPNDPISKKGLEASMNILTQNQEEVRMKKGNNKYAKGGRLSNIFDIGGDKDSWLYKPVTEGFVPSKEDILGEMEEMYPYLKSEELSIAPIVRGASSKSTTTSNNKKSNLSYLRKAPIFMSGLGAISDIFSKPDYSAADIVDGVQINPSFVRATPLGNYLSFTPLDREFYLNKLDANTTAGRRAVMNTSGGNRAAALAGILATDYNYGNQLGDLARKAEEYNQAQRERVAGFNRQTDMFNSEQSLKEQSFNASSRDAATKLSLAKAQDVARLRLAAKTAYDTRRSNNLNNFITNLSNLGQEEAYKEWLDNLADKEVLLMNTSGEYVGKKCKGGKLNRRR